MSELKRHEGTKRSSIDFSDSPSMTEQCHHDEVKIQNIMNKARKTGIVNHVAKYQGTYSDMTNAPDFYTAQNIIAEAKSMFESVPSDIRADFNNDAGQYLAFMQDPKNRDAIEGYGLDASHLPVEAETQPCPTPTPTLTPQEPEGS